jgi:DNA mismatch repair ATPase MutS
MRAAGALIAVLQRDGLLHSDDGASIGSLSHICERSLAGYMTLDPESAEALGIFVRETHASALMSAAGASKQKEGLSVLALLDTCATAQGKRLLRLWMRRPLLDKTALTERLDAVGWLLNTAEAATELASAVKRVRDVPRLLAHLRTPATFTTL